MNKEQTTIKAKIVWDWWDTIAFKDRFRLKNKYFGDQIGLPIEDITAMYKAENPTFAAPTVENKEDSSSEEWICEESTNNVDYIVREQEGNRCIAITCEDGLAAHFQNKRRAKKECELLASAPRLKADNKLLRDTLEEINKVGEMYLENTEKHPDFKMGKESTITNYFETACNKAKSALEQTK